MVISNWCILLSLLHLKLLNDEKMPKIWTVLFLFLNALFAYPFAHSSHCAPLPQCARHSYLFYSQLFFTVHLFNTSKQCGRSSWWGGWRVIVQLQNNYFWLCLFRVDTLMNLHTIIVLFIILHRAEQGYSCISLICMSESKQTNSVTLT